MISGTAWGALNALTERIDWYRGDTETKLAAAMDGHDLGRAVHYN